MTMILFNIKTGEKLNEYLTEEAAVKGMRSANSNEGWTRIGQSWIDGIEREWAVDSNGETGYGPYGITETTRWESWYRPEFISQKVDIE